MQGLSDWQVDFPFRVSPAEQRIIELRREPPQSIILLGRSGTGKTTCAVFRIFGHWLASRHEGQPHNMVCTLLVALLAMNLLDPMSPC